MNDLQFDHSRELCQSGRRRRGSQRFLFRAANGHQFMDLKVGQQVSHTALWLNPGDATG